MKKLRKVLALVLAMVMVLAMGITAFAQDVAYSSTDGYKATITINNPAKGETYTISQSTNSGSYAWGFSWSSSNTSVATVTK